MKSKWIILLLAVATIDADFMYGTSVKHQLDSKTWPHTSGVITQSRLITQSRSLKSTRAGTQASLAYTYKVNGQDCFSRQYKFVGTEPAGEIVDRYPVGTQVTVYYNPEDPLMSVLEPGLTPTDSDNAIFFACLNVLPVGIMWFIGTKYKG